MSPLSNAEHTRDPLFQQTGQAYSYAGGDPVNNSDPSGQCSIGGINYEYGEDPTAWTRPHDRGSPAASMIERE